MRHLGVGKQILRVAGQDQPAAFHHVPPVGDGQRLAHVLLDQKDGHAPVPERAVLGYITIRRSSHAIHD